MTDLTDMLSSAFWRVNPPDADPLETREWLDAFDALVEAEGRERSQVHMARFSVPHESRSACALCTQWVPRCTWSRPQAEGVRSPYMPLGIG